MKLLFICTHNRCRSILAEAIANHYGEGLIEACSAGSSPAEQVHPLTLSTLRNKDISTTGLYSKSWDSFENQDFDYVITVCDRAANEPCPLWFGKSRQIHWGLADPSATKGGSEVISAAFKSTIKTLKRRIKKIRRWLRQGVDEETLTRHMQELAEEFSNGTV
jgi:arsenate reductase